MFRWQRQLTAGGIAPTWTIDVPDASLSLPPHAALAFLRIAQEALTNVLKHAAARQVQVRFRQADDCLELEVEDDGRGGDAATQPDAAWATCARARSSSAASWTCAWDRSAAPAWRCGFP